MGESSAAAKIEGKERNMERDKKGRFVKGNSHAISAEVARDMQRRSAASRKENRTIAETLRAYLNEDAGSGHTRGEILVMQAVNNHKNGKLSFRDLRDLASILGEDTLNIHTDGPAMVVVPEGAVAALNKWKKK